MCVCVCVCVCVSLSLSLILLQVYIFLINIKSILHLFSIQCISVVICLPPFSLLLQEFCKTTASMLDGVEVPSSSFCTSTDPNEKLGVTSGGDLIPSK